jgi:tetratricopeptide (TPR) repeat protein
MIDLLEQNYRTKPSKEGMQHLGETFDKLGFPAMAGYYYLKLAQSKKDDASAWALAGRKFYEAEGMFTGTASFYSLIVESMNAYDKAIELDPRNLDARADQAANIMDLGQGPPMKAVGMLRDILQVDSNNQKAMLYLGIFSVRSAQYEKALKRFIRLTELDPNNAEYHRYLGDTYINMGNNNKGIIELEKYKGLLKDPEAKAQVDNMISAIKNGDQRPNK